MDGCRANAGLVSEHMIKPWTTFCKRHFQINKYVIHLKFQGA